MSNKIQEARAQVAELTQAAYLRAVEAGKLPARRGGEGHH